MKKITLLFSLLTMAVTLSQGCTKSQINKDLDKTMDDLNQKLEQTRLENDRLVDNALKILTEGGQPGSISLNGVAVIDADKLDSRLTVSQEAGLSKAGSATMVAKNVLLLNSLESAKLEDIKTNLKKQEDQRC